MNLVVAGRGLSQDGVRRALGALRKVARRYPGLGEGAIRSWVAGALLLASVETDPEVSAPRRYVSEEERRSVVTYSGVMLDPEGVQPAFDAEALGARWETVADRLEGRFMAVRLDTASPRLEVIVDPLGVEQVFELEHDGAWLCSNSAGVLEAFGRLREPDPVGVSMLFAVDWVGRDRTIRRGVRVVPGGTVTTASDTGVSRRDSFPRASLAHLPQVPFSQDDAVHLAGQLVAMTRRLADDAGVLNVPLSGGHDTRLLTAIVVGGGIPARFWTQGDGDSTDVAIATQIAARYGLEHRVANRPTSTVDSSSTTQDVIDDWDALVRTFSLRTDGIASLALVANIAGSQDSVPRLETTLSGMGGEIARHFPPDPHFFWLRHDADAVTKALLRGYVRHADGLVRAEATSLARQALREFLGQVRADGFRSQDLASIFYAYERDRRWAANNPREFAPTEDKVLLFCTRPFMLAAYATPAEDRYVESIHRGVIQALVPSLLTEPATEHPWRALPGAPPRGWRVRQQIASSVPDAVRPSLARLRSRGRVAAPAVGVMWQEAAWVEAKRGWLRDVIFSQPSSPYWDYVDRTRLEALLSDAASHDERARNALVILAIATPFVYDALTAGDDTEELDV